MAAPLNINTSFAEFIFTVARQAPISMKRHLPEKYFRMINTEKGAQRFAMRGQDWEHKEFLSMLGIQMFTVFADTANFGNDTLRELCSGIDLGDKPTSILKQMGDQMVFVSGSREFCHKLQLMSSLSHTDSYVKTLELLRTGYHMKKWGNKMYVQEYEEMRSNEETLKKAVEFTQAVLWANNLVEETCGVDSPTMRVLLFLYTRNIYVPHEKLRDTMGLTKQQLGASLRKCMKDLYIQKHPVQSRREYLITSKGVIAINRFIDKVMKSFDF